jgi:inosine-uridine nucleoside N-ribohydrolase
VLALIYGLAGPNTDVVGIVPTGGNVVAQQFQANDLGLFELCRATDALVPKGAGVCQEHQRRLTGIDEIVLSLTAQGLTTGK